jgi:general nucleoside transport system ATP-binding protein
MKVHLKNINKHFGPVHANADIDLCIPGGTIQGILGENGAGKSTLMKILSGFIQPDTGEILLDDKPVTIDSPSDAIRYGIGMLHQDPLDFPPMRIIDNFIVGQKGGLVPSYTRAEKEFKELQLQFGFSLNLDTYVDTLTVGERQQLEILRLLWLGARVLILDEPTTGISTQQKVKLFSTLKVLASQGKTIIFVSHKLEDVEQLCGRVSILRKGRLVGDGIVPPYQIDKLVELMFGKVIELGARNNQTQEGLQLELCDLFVEHYPLRIEAANVALRKGEVIGLAGMEGSGQDILLRACAGLIKPTSGKVIVNGKDMSNKTYHVYQENGVSFLPASRMEEGLVPGLTLSEHFTIVSEDQKGFFIDRDHYLNLAQDKIKEYYIIGRPTSPVEALSGGNQQRALLALLRRQLSVILLEHPTRGLDIESAIYMWGKLKERCQQGTSILFISADLEEVLQYSDRILVFYSGRVSQPLDAASTSLEQLGQMIGGKGWEEETPAEGNYGKHP